MLKTNPNAEYKVTFKYGDKNSNKNRKHQSMHSYTVLAKKVIA